MTKLENKDESNLISQAKKLKDKLFSDNKKELDDLKTSIPTPESLILDWPLDDQLFADKDELGIFSKRAEKFMFIDVQQDYIDRNKTKTNCLKKNESKNKNEPDKYTLTLPKNLTKIKVSDIPYLIKQINVFGFDKNVLELPEYASYKEIAIYLKTLISYLSDNSKTDLANKYQVLYNNYFASDFDCAIDEDIKFWFETKFDLESNEIDDDIQSELSSFFKKKLFESVFEWWIKALYENMKAPDSEKYGTLMKKIDKKWKILLKAREKSDSEKILEAEKKLIEEIYNQVTKYENKTVSRQNYMFPDDVLQSKDMLCLSKTMMIGWILDEYGVENEVNEIDRHIYNVFTLSNWKKYVLDGIDEEKEYIWENNIYNNAYEKRILYKSGENFDKEEMMLSEMLHVVSFVTSVDQQDIVALEMALKINPKNVWAYISLWDCYSQMRTDADNKTAYEYYKKALEVITTIIEEKKTEYDLDYEFVKIQSRIYDELYDLNSSNNFEKDELENQKTKKEEFEKKVKELKK